jgi:hypothetical protein
MGAGEKIQSLLDEIQNRMETNDRSGINELIDNVAKF